MADTVGNVTISCIGIDQEVVDGLVAHLREMFDSADKTLAAVNARIEDVLAEARKTGADLRETNTYLRQQIKRYEADVDRARGEADSARAQAERWFTEYQELKESLADREPDDALAAEAAVLLDKGDLAGARAALTKLIERDSAIVERQAKRYYDRARTFDLEYNRPKAVADYRRAYQLAPETERYAEAYASALWRGNRFGEAALIYESLVNRYRAAGKHPERLGLFLSNLGNQLASGKQFSAALRAYRESLDIIENLENKNSHENRNLAANTLSNMGILYMDLNNFPLSLNHFEQSLAIRRTLVNVFPRKQKNHLAITLNNIGNLWYQLRDFASAQEAYEEALSIRRELAVLDPAAHRQHLAVLLNNLGNLLDEIENYPAARESYEEALGLRRDLADRDGAAHRPALAQTLNNFGVVLRNLREYLMAKQALEEAKTILRALANHDPATYQPSLAATLNNLGGLLRIQKEFSAAREAYSESLALRRLLAAKTPNAYKPKIAITLFNMAILEVNDGYPACGYALAVESFSIFSDLKSEHSQAWTYYSARAKKLTNSISFLLEDAPPAPDRNCAVPLAE